MRNLFALYEIETHSGEFMMHGYLTTTHIINISALVCVHLIVGYMLYVFDCLLVIVDPQAVGGTATKRRGTGMHVFELTYMCLDEYCFASHNVYSCVHA